MKLFFNLLSAAASILGVSMILAYIVLIVYEIGRAIKNG